jgi:hypothetical protein
MDKNRVDTITVDTESVEQFIRLTEKEEEWSDEDLTQFISTSGIQYLIQHEEYDEDTVKIILKKVRQGLSKDFGEWAAALKEKTRIKKQLEYFFSRWNYLVERPLSVVRTYLPEEVTREGTYYILPAGPRESYSDEHGFALTLGGAVKEDTHWIFLTAWEAYRYFLTCFAGKGLSIKKCTTPCEFIEAFLDSIHRLGTAVYVAVKAADIEQQFYQEHLADSEKKKSLIGRAFQLALEGKAQPEAETIQKEVFSGYTSPSALLGFQMAKALDEYDKYMGHSLGMDILQGSVEKMGFIPFFEIFKLYEQDFALFPEVVWNAFEMYKLEKGFRQVGESPFFCL